MRNGACEQGGPLALVERDWSEWQIEGVVLGLAMGLEESLPEGSGAVRFVVTVAAFVGNGGS